MDLTAVGGLGATGALVAMLGYLLTHMSKDRSQRLDEVKSYDDRIDRYDDRLQEMEKRIVKLETQIDEEITKRRLAEEDAAREKRGRIEAELSVRRLEEALREAKGIQ